MKTIGNIHLTWRPEKGKKRISVGTIKKSASEGIRFQYNNEGVEEAKKEGFLYYEGFPDVYKTYTENVIDVFGQRLTRSERPDIKDFYDFWRIDISKKDDKFYMLAFTQGLLPTDNFEFLADFNPTTGLTFVTEIAGLSKTQIKSEKLRVDDVLRYELEPHNPVDRYAVKLFKDDLFLGYIKLIHSKVFYKKKKQSPKLTVQSIEKNGIIKRAFIRVSF